MRLFTENVDFIATSGDKNILQIENYEEIFFDVYELIINGEKFISEKIGEYDTHPIVKIPVEIDGVKKEYPFILNEGKFQIVFNEQNELIQESVEENIPVITEEFEEVEEYSKESFEKALIDIQEKKHKILEYIENVKKTANQETDEYNKNQLKILEQQKQQNKKELQSFLESSKESWFEEFVDVSDKIKKELFDRLNINNSEIYESIDLKLEVISDDFKKLINEDFSNTEKIFENKIKELITEIYNNQVIKVINDGIDKISEQSEISFENIKNDFDLALSEKANDADLKNVENKLENEILSIQKESIELHDLISKTASSNQKSIIFIENKIDETQIELKESIVKIIDEKIEENEDNITTYYNEKLDIVENKLIDLSDENRQYFIGLINESKDNLLKEIKSIKENKAVEYIVENKKTGEKKEIDINSIKNDLQKEISNKISNEIIALRKYTAYHGGGGGTVAQQFANGGTMNGSLTIVGTISASQFLGIPVYTDTDTLSTVTGRGNTTTDSITVGGMTVLGGLTADRIYTTQLEALSANITVLDIKQYELSGFNVQGDCTIQGNVSASGTITADNMILSGNRVATVVDPVRTTLFGNGTTTVFPISGADGLVNPSALIVAIDGALQEPVVDYTVTSGNITFTSPLADGSKAVVISPSHTLQVSQMIPADGSVSSSKLDTDIAIAGQLTVTGQPALSALNSNHVMTYGLAEDQYAWIDLPAAFANFSSLGGSTSVSVIGASIDTGASTASFSTARTRFAGFFNRSPLAWTGGQARNIPFASRRTRLRAIIDTFTLLGNAYFWFGVWDKNSLISTTDEFDAKGFGVKITPTTLIAQTHDGTTLFQSDPSSLVLNNTVLLEIDYYQQNLSVKVDGAVIATVSGGYNIDSTAQIHFYGYAPNGGSAGDNARAELKQLRYLITEN